MSSAKPPVDEANSASNRHFYHSCTTIISLDPSAEPVHVCPNCHEELTQVSDHPSSSSATTTSLILRRVTFKHRKPTQSFIYVVSESDFFSTPYPNLPPFPRPLLGAGSILSFGFIRRYMNYCVNEGTNINCNLLQQQILELFQNYANLNCPLRVPLSLSDIVFLSDIMITDDLVNSYGAECAICLEGFKIGEEAKKLPCKHLFYKEYVVSWLKLSNSCPVCHFEFKIYDPISERLRAAWCSQPPVSSAVSEQMVGSEEQRRSGSMATRFEIELQWPVVSRFSRFEIGSSSYGHSEDCGDNEASGSGEQESDL